MKAGELVGPRDTYAPVFIFRNELDRSSVAWCCAGSAVINDDDGTITSGCDVDSTTCSCLFLFVVDEGSIEKDPFPRYSVVCYTAVDTTCGRERRVSPEYSADSSE